MKVDIFNINGEKTGSSQDLPEAIYGIEPNEHCVYLAVKAYNAAQRQGTHSAKERNAVSGSGKKLKRQKGTGTARAGDIKNPLFRGGGRIFGPRPRDYSMKLNKKVKNLARLSVLADKAQNDNIVVIESLSFAEPKTKEFNAFLGGLNLADKKVLVVTKEPNRNAYLSSRNLRNVEIAHGTTFNIHQMLKADKLVIEKDAIEDLNAFLA